MKNPKEILDQVPQLTQVEKDIILKDLAKWMESQKKEFVTRDACSAIDHLIKEMKG